MFDAKKLKNCMEAQGVSERTLADAVGVSQSFINHLTKGFRQPQLSVAARIAGYFGKTVDEFIVKEGGQ